MSCSRHAKHHLAARKVSKIARSQAFLNVDGAPQGVNGAREFRQDRVACCIEDPAVGPGDEVFKRPSIDGEAAERFLLVFCDETAVTDYVGRENGGNLASHVFTLRANEAVNAR
jgi:hypothetical protein